MIFLKAVLEEMEETDKAGQLKPFSIEFVKADRNKKTGGDIVSIEKAVILKRMNYSSTTSTAVQQSGKNKKSNHWENSTRNILLPNGQKRKLHIRLITKFNGQPVIY
jgi:hypothetical protein